MDRKDIAAELAEIAGRLAALATHLTPAEEQAAPPPQHKVTAEELRAALTKLASVKGSAAAKALLKDFGADKFSDIAAQDYGEVLAAAVMQS